MWITYDWRFRNVVQSDCENCDLKIKKTVENNRPFLYAWRNYCRGKTAKLHYIPSARRLQFVNNCPFEIFNTVRCFCVVSNVVTASIVKICKYFPSLKEILWIRVLSTYTFTRVNIIRTFTSVLQGVHL